MKIQEIYKKYKIMPQLQLHMLRVAGVASVITDNFIKLLDKNAIVSASLLHDMGNIIKFDLSMFPEHVKPQGLNYWKKVKQEYTSKYGQDEHTATYTICKEIGVEKKVYDLVNSFGFSRADKNYRHNNFEKKICAYSDHRVSPHGIALLEQRMMEGKKRYVKNKRVSPGDYDEKRFKYLVNFTRKIEKQIFVHCKTNPDEITEETVKPLIKKLRSFEISTN